MDNRERFEYGATGHTHAYCASCDHYLWRLASRVVELEARAKRFKSGFAYGLLGVAAAQCFITYVLLWP